MADKQVVVAVDFTTKALEIADRLCLVAEHPGKTGAEYAKAQAALIREVYEVLITSTKPPAPRNSSVSVSTY